QNLRGVRAWIGRQLETILAHIGVLCHTRGFERIQTRSGWVWCSRGQKDLQDTMLTRQATPGPTVLRPGNGLTASVFQASPLSILPFLVVRCANLKLHGCNTSWLVMMAYLT